MASIKKINETVEFLKTYNGTNPYILMLKRDAVSKGQVSIIGDFQVEYIEKNKDFVPVPINRMTKLADWYATQKQKDWNLEFLPQKLKIISLLGETATNYHCYAQYRQSVEPKMMFLPKKAVLKDFLVENYNNLYVNFDRYDKLASLKSPNRKLLPHQKEAVKFLLSRKKCILADMMGLGKTTSLSVAAIEGNFDSILIICPASLKSNWVSELEWYTDSRNITMIDSFQDKNKGELEVMLGYAKGKSGKKVSELMDEMKERGKWESNKFVIVNFEILDEFYKKPQTRSKANKDKSFSDSPLLRYIYNRKSLIIIDEAHRLSNSTSDTYKLIKSLIKEGKPEAIYLSTGTPVTNNTQNLYCLLNLLDSPITADYNYYMERYCGAKKMVHPQDKEKRNRISEAFITARGKSNWYTLTDQEKDDLRKQIERSCRMIRVANDSTNLDELKDRISHIYLRRTKEDLENSLPAKHIYELHYDLTPVQKQEYDRLWAEYEALKKEENPDIELNKDLLEGGIYRRYLSNQMVPHTIEMVDKLIAKCEKVVIACCFDEELYALRDYYNDKCVVYNGKLSLKQKDAAISKFKNDENTQIFLGNVIAAGVGLTLTESCYLIFNDISFVPGDNQQMMDRIHRIGQNRECHVYFQIFDDTQYENMWNIVIKKTMIIDQIIKKENEK